MSVPGPTATVAIPVFNSAATIGAAIASAQRQTLADIEILVTDDASTDDSAAIAERVARDDPRVRVIRLSRNRGKPHAMNTMVAAATGTWVAVLDADDAYHPARLERLIAAAESAGVEMAADNINYVDAEAKCIVRTAFSPTSEPRIIAKADLAANTDAYAGFDFGILKPVVRRDFVIAKALSYREEALLAEDFYYLLAFLVAGGRAYLGNEPLYDWTMPFGSISRRWTRTGLGAWRYDYRKALPTNRHFIQEMQRQGEREIVALLEVRDRQFRAMVHYIDAQRLAADRRWLDAAATIARHPSTYSLLARRVAGRGRRLVQRRQPVVPLIRALETEKGS